MDGWVIFDCFFPDVAENSFLFFSFQYKIDSLYFNKDKQKKKWKTQGHEQRK